MGADTGRKAQVRAFAGFEVARALLGGNEGKAPRQCKVHASPAPVWPPPACIRGSGQP